MGDKRRKERDGRQNAQLGAHANFSHQRANTAKLFCQGLAIFLYFSIVEFENLIDEGLAVGALA